MSFTVVVRQMYDLIVKLVLHRCKRCIFTGVQGCNMFSCAAINCCKCRGKYAKVTTCSYLEGNVVETDKLAMTGFCSKDSSH